MWRKVLKNVGLVLLYAATIWLIILSAGCGPRGPKGHPSPADCSLTGTYAFGWAEWEPRTDWWHYSFKAAGHWREWADSAAWSLVELPGTWSARRGIVGSSVQVTFEPDSAGLDVVTWPLLPDKRKRCQWLDPRDPHWVFTLVERDVAARLRRAARN